MSGWVTVTIEADETDSYDEIADTFSGYVEDPERYIRVSGDQLHILDWGYGADGSRSALERTADLWDRAVIMECNDTTDSGSGTGYVSEDGSVERVEKSHGVEGARGYDASDAVSRVLDGHVFMR